MLKRYFCTDYFVPLCANINYYCFIISTVVDNQVNYEED